MRTHELHPALVHAPLTLLPLAAAVDTAAVASGSPELDRAGRLLWALGAGSGAVAGLAGLAASQEVQVDRAETDDTMFLHGIGNALVSCAAVGMAVWRTRNRPTVPSSCVGWSAIALAGYTAYLGGELVYQHGVGVRAGSPPLLSARAPRALARDAKWGVRWLVRRALEVVSGRHRISPSAFEAKPLKRLR